MAELLLSAFLDVLFDRLTSPELLKFARREGLRNQLGKWSKTVERIQEVLDDAEEKQQTKQTVKAWLDDLRDLAYDVEDILDEFATEALQRKLMAGESQASASMVRNLVPACCTSLTPSAVTIKFRLGSKIEKISTRFNDLVTQKDQLHLKENSSTRPTKRKIRPSTSVVTEDEIYGREEVKEAVLQLLVSEKHSDASNKVPIVIPIVGMGGIGKTTLAQLVYNDKKVDSFFDFKAWACVSEDFDAATVTKTILQSVTLKNCDGKDLNSLQVELKEKLSGKRFLVILDDVWNDNYEDWDRLRAPFVAGALGSSIMVTTRNQRVSSMMGTIKVEPFQLELLPTDACLSIFSLHALDAKDFGAHPNLKDIGEEIVKRCKGLPLAVKTVGGVLRGTQDRNEWDKVLKSKIWDIQEKSSGIVPALMLSYHHLPSHLKRCFAYCSILPKDYEFKEKEVVLLWMAEGLINPGQDEEEMEDLGREYFRNLLSRSFFQKSRGIYESKFVMHDLINDLAQSVAGDTCFRMEDRVGGNKHDNIPIKARHSSYLGSQYDVTKRFEVFSKLTSLRTFLPLMLPYSSFLAHRVPFELVSTLRCLRVLSFKSYCITELPDSIGDLKHLRYLDLSKTRIRLLSESITSLYNLQTLLLKKCTRLKKLPSKFRNLVNLRHLNIERAESLEGMPMQIGKLTCLQTLSNLVLGKDNCSGIKELGPLKHLGGRLCISRLENVIEATDAKDAELIKKTKISALSLKWSRHIDASKDTTSELEVLNGLQPHDALKELRITNYGGTKFPNWLTPPSFPNMVSLRLENCYKCTSLPPLGKYSPSLKNLWIEDMEECEQWSPCEEFPNLRELCLRKCPKLLGKLPNNLPLLNDVEIIDCAQLVVSISCFPDKCKFKIDNSSGVVCGSKVTFKSIKFDRSLSPISDMEGLAELEELTIADCEELTNLWSDNMGSLPHDLPFLRRLEIYNCPKLVSLVAEEVDQEYLQLIIESIYIYNCNALESLPKSLMYNNTCLQDIKLVRCDSLTHFARSHLPPTLKKLYIEQCKSMRNLVEDDDNDTNNNSTFCSGITSLLEFLQVYYCPSLESLTSSGELPATLQELYIMNCPKLESVAKSFHHNSSLTDITIAYCENLQLLNGGDQLLLLTSLQHLKIWNCPSILSFPKEGFPTNLTTLEIGDIKITQALFDWGLDKFTYLNRLQIGGCQNLVSFPEMTLPASLTSLHISKFSNLEYLSSEGLRKLTSLKDLSIYHCEKLTCFLEDGLPPSLLVLNIFHCQKLMSLPKNGLPPSLLKLRIWDCQKLMSLPKNGLPPSLLELCIHDCQKLMSLPKNGLPPSLQTLAINLCPLLEKHCKKDQRGEWRKIADIPFVLINDTYIYETETEE
ncbi:putative disease resistance RPP13-like protein 1 [Carya illinoinensis]|uniref:Disease resistance RPP13-like protein 1 n=1 Tax=Carya illinoinensis TaxID=32201 RepID=A0A8T1N2N0_CARIL|nr:putative disease resistance RPP13-like protein 1 [Carya illinoinensis]KAG6625386.1 hypothetical protein CIPAW_16G092600 [Carya illinoinensis]